MKLTAANTVDVDTLEVGDIYLLSCRNLRFGVYSGRGFTGIRLKFNSRFLDTEYPNTMSEMGSVVSAQRVGRVSEKLSLKESLGTACQGCGGKAWWTGPPTPASWACENNCEDVHSVSVNNVDLYEAMESLERAQPNKNVFLDPAEKVVVDRPRITKLTAEQTELVNGLADGCEMVLVEHHLFVDENRHVTDEGVRVTRFPGECVLVHSDGSVEQEAISE